MASNRYKIGDKFNIEVTLEIEAFEGDEYDNHWVYLMCDLIDSSITLDFDSFEDLVNPTSKLIRLQKEREELDKQIEETKKRLGG